jgi:hypothetical protein
VGDGILWTSLYAKAAKYAAAIVDVINAGVAFIAANAVHIGTRVVLGLDIDAVRRTSGGAQVTCDAFFLAVLIDVKQMLAAVTGLYRNWHIRILNGPFFARYL